jgi:serine/threonine protein kinase
MICCLNPHCLKENPPCPDGTKFCSSCGTELILLSDRYRPIKRLGEGGFGITYLAEDNNRFSKPCVIKQLTLKIPDAQRLFEGEARRLEELADYPAIPRLLSYYSDTNYLYLVQEFVEGQDLSKELAEKGCFKEVEVKDFLNAILPILDVIHNKGIIHRDIKLENIMRRSDGKIVLIDFGIAKIIAENNTITPGTRAGTNGYAAPEQMKDGIATPASDLYSLGAACFYLLTNFPPGNMFMDYGYQWTMNWRQHLKQPIDQKLDRVIDKLLKTNYQDRYQSASEVMKSFDVQALQSAPTSISYGVKTGEDKQQEFALLKMVALGILATIGALFFIIICLGFYSISSLNNIIEAGDALLEKDKEGAVKKYTEAIEMNDSSDTAYSRRGNALYLLGRKKDAIKDYNKAIELDANVSAYYRERADVVSDTGDKKGSIKDYDQAIKHDPDNSDAFNNRGFVKFELEDVKGALEDYNKAVALKSDNITNYAIYYSNRGAAKFSLDDKKGALEDFEQAIKIDPDCSDAYFQRGNSSLISGDKQGAIRDYRKAAELAKKQGKTKDYENATKALKQLGQ